MKKFLLISLLLLIALPALAIPQKIYLQGILKDVNDNKLDGTYDIVFKIYSTATGGTALWQETQSNVQVDKGLYTAVLGSNTTFPSTLFSNDNLYVGIQVGSDPEMTPRIQMLSVPYALNSDLLDGYNASDFALSSSAGGNYVILGRTSKQSTDAAKAVWVESTNPTGIGVYGEGSSGVKGEDLTGNNFGWLGGSNYGVSGTGTTYGGRFSTGNTSGYGVYGDVKALTGTNYGGYFMSGSSLGRGVHGEGFVGVEGISSVFGGSGVIGNGILIGGGFLASSPEGRAVYGVANDTTGTNYGGYFMSNSSSGYGAYGLANRNTGSNFGVYGKTNSPSGYGAYGQYDSNRYGFLGSTSYGAYGNYGTDKWGYMGSDQYGGKFKCFDTSSDTPRSGVYAEATSYGLANGVWGWAESTYGGSARYGRGVYGGGRTNVANGVTYGVHGYAWTGQNNTTGYGVYGDGYTVNSGGTIYGVYGTASGVGGSTQWAGWFEGDVHVNGEITATTKTFIIDHPIAPKDKILRHSVVESPDMKNVYDGVIYLDKNGEAIVELPSYFEALNEDFRYQLTTIGNYAPVFIKEKIKDNKFKIAGGKPDMEVCWMVTGIRHDAYALKHPVVVEEAKDNKKYMRGFYLHPNAFGKEEIYSNEYLKNPRGREKIVNISGIFYAHKSLIKIYKNGDSIVVKGEIPVSKSGNIKIFFDKDLAKYISDANYDICLSDASASKIKITEKTTEYFVADFDLEKEFERGESAIVNWEMAVKTDKAYELAKDKDLKISMAK